MKADNEETKPRPNMGGHYYPGCEGDGDSFYTSDCEYGCGCWMGGSRSGGPDGIDPFGDCPYTPTFPEKEDLILVVQVYAGTAQPHEIADILSDLSILFRKYGGSGIRWSLGDVKIQE